MNGKTLRADWLHDAKWGVFIHYLFEIVAPESLGNAAVWNQLVDAFDVAGLAEQLREVKAKYLILSLGQNSGYYCVPNATYDRIVDPPPGKCAQRDLVSDIYVALARYGIRLMVYLPSGAPANDPQAIEKLAWKRGGRCEEFQRKWEAVIREWSLRWGNKVSGWWFDGCYYNDEMYRYPDGPNFSSFAAAVRAGNPDSLIAWNPGVSYPPYTVDKEEDYTGGEVNELQEVDILGRWEKHAQFHILSFVGKYWGQLPIRFTAEELIKHTRSFTDYGGVVTWDAPCAANGLIHHDVCRMLKKLGRAIDSTRNEIDKAPPKLVRPVIDFVKVPLIDKRKKDEGHLRLTLKNPWSEPIHGAVEMAVEPASFAEFNGGTHFTYDLAPRAESCHELTFYVYGSDSRSCTDVKIVLTRTGDGRNLSYRFPVRESVSIPRLNSQPVIGRLEGAMKDIAARQFISEKGQCMAEVKLAIVGEFLAVWADINDEIMRQTPNFWDGSCMEVFGTLSEDDGIKQLFLVPGNDHNPTKALQYVSRGRHAEPLIIQPPELQFISHAKEVGYFSAALIPLAWWLNTPELPESFYFEIVINAGLDTKNFTRVAMFGSINTSQCSQRYAYAQIQKT